jgi:GTP cyclohydrolase II
MFAYIDPSIRERLIETGQLIRIDARGKPIDVDSVSADSDLTLNVVGPIPMPVDIGEGNSVFQWYAFVRHTELARANEIADALRSRGDQRLFSMLASNMSVNSALVFGEPQLAEEPLVRVHSCCLTGDVFGSKRCECGPQFLWALDRIQEHGPGVLVYMSGHEGRGIGLWAKAITYLLQDAGQDTYQANRSLGLPDDSRDFRDAAAMLLYLLGGDRPIRLLTNNPKKVNDLRERGLTGITTEQIVVGVNQYNRKYLHAKRGWGHQLEPDDITEGRKR